MDSTLVCSQYIEYDIARHSTYLITMRQIDGAIIGKQLLYTDEQIANDEVKEVSNLKSALEREANRILLALEELAALPEEPADDVVVWVRMNYNDPSRYYHYAGTRSSNGLWYFTGKRTLQRWPNGCTWEQWCLWLKDWPHEMWAATDYVRIGGDL